jgi:hypothetical protein
VNCSNSQPGPAESVVGTRSTAGRVSGLATASAILSAVGLGIGHILGLVLAVAAVRKMDDSKGSLYGYRLGLTGCILGLIGVFWIPFGLPPLLEHPIEPQVLLVAIISQIELPVFLLLFAWQDRLKAPQCEYGYRFLGPHQERIPMDVFLAIVGTLLGAGLVALGLLRPDLLQLRPAIIGGGCVLVLLSLGALLGRRGCRALWLFLVIALALGAAVYFHRL